MKLKLTCLLILTGILLSGFAAIADTSEFFDQVNYKGAFGSSIWMKGWTALDEYDFLVEDKVSAGQVTVTDESINAGDVVYWTADNTYVLDGLVYVEAGAVLNIEAGTVIKAKVGSSENASALIISKGAKIFAEGTAAKPIIFTAESDDVTDPYDVTPDVRGQWGGLIILGHAIINEAGGVDYVEGIAEESERTQFGGNDDDDNSGVLRYVSIRHGGTELAPGDEINGLTLGAVGRGTTIEYVEVFANKDDGFEWFGGTVNCKHLIAAYCGDDGFDHDEGLRNKMQFLFTLQDSAAAGRSGEHDGGHDPEDGEPFAYPVIYNATYVGPGMESSQTDVALKLRDNWGGEYVNSIFGDRSGKALDIEQTDNYAQDSKKRLDDGEIVIKNNLWFNFAPGMTADSLGVNPWDVAVFENDANMNELLDASPLASISRDQDNGLDPRPVQDGPAYQNLAEIPQDDFFEQVNYKGAFGSTNWMKGWTALDEYDMLVEDKVAANQVTVTDESINAGDMVYWTADNTYVLDGLVYVESGAMLNIEAGTIVKARSGSSENTSALIVSKGGKIYAEGTGVNPIIFTAESDDVTDPYDVTPDVRGQWGGLIVLGHAVINEAGGIDYVEGIAEESDRTQFGGNDDHDNSGVLRYVSIRHAGTELAPGDEINGLTLGAVGNGTTIDHIEVFANKDDGFEWFGGNVNCKYLIAAYCGDDGFDHDEGIRSKMQFLFTLQDSAAAGRAGEHDGGHDPEDGEPFAYPVIYNASYFGPGMESSQTDVALKLRDNWGGEYKNSIFGDRSGKALDIEQTDNYEQDSKKRLDDGQIVIMNNLWFNFAPGMTADSLGVNPWDVAVFDDASNMNELLTTTPVVSISRDQDKGLDPRPVQDGPAYQNLAGYPMMETGVEVVNRSETLPVENQLVQNYPNPFNPVTTIQYDLNAASRVKLTVFNTRGQQVAELVNHLQQAGSYTVTWNASDMPSGVYLYTLETGSRIITRKMMLIK
ncbi:MAG: T9SS type A sorting domain-containing protein [candidate division KSB1 bacterium]|nr:T9SS type A sorting domain-containing protein [candidate division KSB1 bacterium]